MGRENLNLNLLNQREGQITEVIKISIGEDLNEEESKEFGEFKIENTDDELILRDKTNEENNIHIRWDDLLEIEEDCDEGCIEIICIDRIVRINQI